MSYIGNKPATSFETVQKQISTSNSGTTITLDRAVTSVQDILLTIDAVVQSYDNYSVSGTTLTVGGTLNNNRVEILFVGRTMQSVDPTDDSVSASKIKTDAVTTAKVQNDAITVDKLNLISTSSVPSLEAKGDGSSQDGYIQLNCSQNSHGVKLKSPPHSANQSYTLTLPATAPASNKMLQTDGSGNLSFVDAPSGGLVYVGGTSSTSEVAALTADNVFSSTYQNYLIVYGITLISGSNNIKLQFQVRHGGTTVTSSDYKTAGAYFDTQVTSAGNLNYVSNNTASATRITIGGQALSNSANLKTCAGTLYCFDTNASDEFKTFLNDNVSQNWSGYAQRTMSAGQYAADQAIDGITFFAGSDNLRNGYFRVYGIVNS
jgi:hypothetical protein